ncbi:DUF6541 family protein [Arsenicicoccus dermatophilus]|uniref:DUF6541 family protein n=1 Tax=Arsenicicoccus dermatophilus TaxID=1076331 RepID=UPI0039172422
MRLRRRGLRLRRRRSHRGAAGRGQGRRHGDQGRLILFHPLATWWAAAPVVLASLALLVLPGLALLIPARVPPWLAVGAAPAASAGVAALAITWTTCLGIGWGAGPLALTALVGGGALWVLGRHWTRLARPAPADAGRVATYALATTGTVAASWVVLAGAVGRPDALQQSHDAGFHVNALARVLATGDAGWFTVGATAAPGSTRTFYPSGLHALGALLAQLTGAHPVVVLNTLVVVLAAIVWPVGMLTLLRTTSRDPRSAVAVAALLPVTLVFPTLLMNFGVLWSNLAGLALAPALMALAVRTCRPGYLRPRAVLALVVVVCGLGVGVVHPAALLSALLLVAPLVVGTLWTGTVRSFVGHPLRRRRVLQALAVASVGLVVGAVLVARTPTVRSLVHSRSRTVTTADVAVAEILTLGTHLTPGWLVLALLVLAGVVVSLWRGRPWVPVGLVLVATCYVCAASIDTGWGTLVTALWDREPYRVAAAIAIPALLLAGQGAAGLVDLGRRLPGLGGRPVVGQTVAAVLVATPVLLGWPSGVASAQRLIGHNYGDQQWWRTVVSRREAQTYAEVLGPRTDGRAVAGDPFGGGQWAGVLSGHPATFAHFGGRYDGDHGVLRMHLRELTPQVCAAARRLDVGYVVEDTDLVWADDPRRVLFAGLHGLAGVPGLTRIGGTGTVSVYALTGC